MVVNGHGRAATVMIVKPSRDRPPRLVALLLAALVPAVAARADSVVMKSGQTFQTIRPPDRDNTLMFLWDGLKKIVVRDSKVDRVIPDGSLRTGEKFSLVQPMTVHAGIMPKDVAGVIAEPWDDKGRRQFQYIGSKGGRPVSMEQAINEIDQYSVRYRGVDGFWRGRVALSQVPRSVIMSLLHRVDQKDESERERVVRYLMGAGWHAEAKEELDRLVKDFPDDDLKARAETARQFIIQAEATQRRSEIDVRRRAQQFEAVEELLKTFDDDQIRTDLQVEARELQRRLDEQRAADRAVDADLLRLGLKLSPQIKEQWRSRLAEVHRALRDAPEAVRDRLAAWRKARAEGTSDDETELALAMSGYVAGLENAVASLVTADAYWQARDQIVAYLASDDIATRYEILARLDNLDWPEEDPAAPGLVRLAIAERIIQLMPPPLHRDEPEVDEEPIYNVVEIEDSIPTEYLAKLPPEYHPLRSYPAVVVLHSGNGPKSAIEAWEVEAARRGYILVAPEYGVSDRPSPYGYTPSEHAAVELAVRDARKRYAIDGDRVYLAGQLEGGNMAWDVALGHPDLFAGVVVVSGFPAKYVSRYLGHHERMPLLCVIGDLAPAANEVVFGSFVKPMITKARDVTYIELNRRGLEEFPEEMTTYFDWMDRRSREAVPREFEASTARICDDRWHGVVIKGFADGRTTSAEATDPLGRNLNPATIKLRTSGLSNLVDVQVAGITQLDVWLSPKLVDFKRKLEVRVNRKALYKGQPELEFQPMLEDLRLRGDRQQIYWVKISSS